MGHGTLWNQVDSDPVVAIESYYRNNLLDGKAAMPTLSKSETIRKREMRQAPRFPTTSSVIISVFQLLLQINR
jgi:hypothetical protein